MQQNPCNQSQYTKIYCIYIHRQQKKKLEGKTLKDVICNNNKKNRPNENVQECYRANLTTT